MHVFNENELILRKRIYIKTQSFCNYTLFLVYLPVKVFFLFACFFMDCTNILGIITPLTSIYLPAYLWGLAEIVLTLCLKAKSQCPTPGKVSLTSIKFQVGNYPDWWDIKSSQQFVLIYIFQIYITKVIYIYIYIRPW